MINQNLLMKTFLAGLLGCWLLLAAGCASSGKLRVTGVGCPGQETEQHMKRLTACQQARDDAWMQIYNHCRAMPMDENTFLGDEMTVDVDLKTQVLNSIWNATILNQEYNPETETAQVDVEFDIERFKKMLSKWQ